eukprot:360049-Chlamydomonas_euryale.AAC.8
MCAVEPRQSGGASKGQRKVCTHVHPKSRSFTSSSCLPKTRHPLKRRSSSGGGEHPVAVRVELPRPGARRLLHNALLLVATKSEMDACAHGQQAETTSGQIPSHAIPAIAHG